MNHRELKERISKNCYQNASNGYVLTPSSLASEMVNTLPTSVLESKISTFLDPICKNGTFLVEIVERLYDKGHSVGNIQKRIYTIDDNRSSLNVAEGTIQKVLNLKNKINYEPKNQWIETYFDKLITHVSRGKFRTFKKFLDIIILNKEDKKLAKSVQDNINKFIESYEKVSKLESKLFGEVFTPGALIDEMIDTLPEEVFKDENGKWLDPAVGIGNFPAKILERLMVGLQDVIPNEYDRKKHILENMLYMCDISTKNLFLLYQLFDKNNEFKLNVYRGSFLSEGFDKHMKEVWGLDGFSVVIGNPPYNDSNDGLNNKTTNIYHHFVIKSINLSTSVLMVTPARWLGMPNMSEFRDKIIINNIRTLRKIDHDVFKNVGIDGGVCYFLIDRDFHGECKIILSPEKHYNTKLTTGQPIIISDKINIINSILNKTKSDKNLSQIYKNPQRIKSNDKRLLESGITPVICSKNNTRFVSDIEIVDPFYYDKHRVIFERVNGGYKKTGINGLRLLKPGYLTTQSISFFPVSDDSEGENLISYLNTKLVFLLRDINQFDKNFTSIVFSRVPLLPFNIKWNDSMLYEYFNLNQEEIDLIENIIKD